MAGPAHKDAEASSTPPPARPPVVVKKYANRRLYNTESSSYITLDNLADMVRAGRDFVVYDAKTGDDITRGVLTQIIVEEEGKGQNLLPTNFLRQLIGFYGGAMQGVVPDYLDQAMKSFTQQQEQVQSAMRKTVGLFPFGNLDELSRQNMAMMERAFSMFTPPRAGTGAGTGSEAGPGSGSGAGGTEAPVDVAVKENAALRDEIERLRRELAAKGNSKS